MKFKCLIGLHNWVADEKYQPTEKGMTVCTCSECFDRRIVNPRKK